MNESIPRIKFGEDVESQANQLLLSDEEYQARATPIKSMQVVKAQHHEQLINTLKMNNLEPMLAEAENLIRDDLSSAISPNECQTVVQELNQCENLFESFKESLKERTTLQSKCNLSNESLIHIYKLTCHYVEKKEYSKAISVLFFLAALNPVIAIFWRSLGLCLIELDRKQEAEIMFKMESALAPKQTAHE